MVFFTCNHCGESLKKQAVDKHGWRCKRELNVSCMDCQKDFHGNAYDAHTSCITEAEKYSGKDYVPKASSNKGARKQEAWIDTIRAITENRKQQLSKGVSDAFAVIRRNDNIPRKQKGFMNFFQNSAKHIRKPDVEAAWALIEAEVKQAAQRTEEENALAHSVSNGNAKRKAESPDKEEPVKKRVKCADSENATEDTVNLLNGSKEFGEPPVRNGSGKFQWNDAIRDVLLSKNNQMKLAKLKKKVLKRYRQFVGSADDMNVKFEKRFHKKLSTAGLVEVRNDTVHLIS